MPELIISVSGLRGIVGETLSPTVASRYAAAFVASLSQPGPIIVGRDGRTSGPMLRSAVIASLTACGRECIDIDVAATPTIGVLIRDLAAAGGIQISASHNPAAYNGIKLFDSDGRVVGADAGSDIRQQYQRLTAGVEPDWVPHDRIGVVTTRSNPHAPHLTAVLNTVDADAIAAKHFRVLLDSNHGAGGLLGRRLLESLGCDVVMMGEQPTGQFAHVPEPTADNLSDIGRRVAAEKCDVGFCQDPDADRLALLDETGRYIGEEFTLAICVDRILSNPATRGPIVINGATSGMSERIAQKFKVGCHRSAVGEANVADLMVEVGAVYGGEGNGGPIDPNVGYVRDSFVGMAQVLDAMVRAKKPLSQIADGLPQLQIVKTKLELPAQRLPNLNDRLQRHFSDAVADTGDGLRLAWPDRWLLIRGSNTEPIVRFIAEAETLDVATEMCETAMQMAAL